jgi:hypothetical protein
MTITRDGRTTAEPRKRGDSNPRSLAGRSLSRCSVGRPWGARVLVSGPASFALVQRGGIGLWSALMSTGRATASLAGHPGDLPARGRGRPLRPEATDPTGGRVQTCRSARCRCPWMSMPPCPCAARCHAVRHAAISWSAQPYLNTAPTGQRGGGTGVVIRVGVTQLDTRTDPPKIIKALRGMITPADLIRPGCC